MNTKFNLLSTIENSLEKNLGKLLTESFLFDSDAIWIASEDDSGKVQINFESPCMENSTVKPEVLLTLKVEDNFLYSELRVSVLGSESSINVRRLFEKPLKAKLSLKSSTDEALLIALDKFSRSVFWVKTEDILERVLAFSYRQDAIAKANSISENAFRNNQAAVKELSAEFSADSKEEQAAQVGTGLATDRLVKPKAAPPQVNQPDFNFNLTSDLFSNALPSSESAAAYFKQQVAFANYLIKANQALLSFWGLVKN